MTHRLATNYAKNYCNRTLIVKVIVENVVTCFLGTQCSITQWTRFKTSAEQDSSGTCEIYTRSHEHFEPKTVRIQDTSDIRFVQFGRLA